jgi:hypothetical protein
MAAENLLPVGLGAGLRNAKWRLTNLVAFALILSLCFWTDTAIGGEKAADTESRYLDPESQSAHLAEAITRSATASLCEHGRFGPKCEFECHGGEGGFCTDEGIVCFLGESSSPQHKHLQNSS